MAALVRAGLVFGLAVSALGCVGPDDTPSNVKDLRVLAVSFEPPEIMLESCAGLLPGAAGRGADGGAGADAGVGRLPGATDAGTPAQVPKNLPPRLTALIADPKGGGRTLKFDVSTCPSPSDRTCAVAEDRLEIDAGTTLAGELSMMTSLPFLRLPAWDNKLLLEETVARDTYRGLGGARVPVVVHVSAEDTGEAVYAQKLMVFSCKFFPEQKQNVTPVLPGLRLQGEAWADDKLPVLRGRGPFVVEPEDFSALEEDYTVPSLQLEPVALKESWKIAWHSDLGRFNQNQTGGTDFDGTTQRHKVEWSPAGADEQDVTFWAVVRDGRGGQSWLLRKAHWVP